MSSAWRSSRAESWIEGVDVLVGLTAGASGAYAQRVSDSHGQARARVVLPAAARGRAVLDVEVFRPLVTAPCLRVEEHGRLTVGWGTAS